MKHRILLSFLISIAPLICAAAENSYVITNPGPGGGSDLWTLVFHPTDADTFYVGGDIEGPFKTIDGGLTYNRVSNGLQSESYPAGANASQDFGIDPQAPDTVFLATWAGIYKTTNGASSWSLVYPAEPLLGEDSESFSSVAVSPHDSNIVLAGNGNPFANEGGLSRIVRSTDGGNSWSVIDLTSGGLLDGSDLTVHRIVFDPLTAGVVYAATGEGVIRSTDSGSSWTLMNTGLPAASDDSRPIVHGLVGTVSNNVFLLFSTLRTQDTSSWNAGGVFRSQDGAANWEDISGNLPTFGSESSMSYSYWRVAVDPEDPNNVIVGTRREWAWDEMGLYKTTAALAADTGTITWTWLWDTENFSTSITDWGWLDSDWWLDQHIHFVGYSPVQSGVLFAGSDNVYKSSDGGATWDERWTINNGDGTYTGRGMELMEVFDITVDPSDGNTWWIGYDDMGLFKTEDDGQTFRRMDAEQNDSNLGDTDCACQIVVDPDDSNTLYVVRHGGDEEGKTNWRRGFLYKSSDDGATWSQLGQGQIEGGRPYVVMLNGGASSTRELVVALYGTGMFRSTDSGATWTSANSGIESNDLANLWTLTESPAAPGTLYLGTADAQRDSSSYTGSIYRSTDSGANWTKIDSATTPTSQILDLAVDTNGVVYAATTSTDSWLAPGEGTGMGGLYRSADDGANWTRVLDQPRVDGVDIHPTDSTIVAAAVSTGWNQFEEGDPDLVSPGIYVSTDSGLTYSRENNGLTFNFFWMLKADPVTPGRFFLGTRGGGFFAASAGTSETQYLMTNSASENVTSLHVVNSSSVNQSFTGTLYNGSGTQLGSANQALHGGSVASKGRVILTAAQLESIFDVSPWSGPAMLEVSGTANFELMSKLVSPSGLISNTNCVRESAVMNIEGFDSSNRTYVRFINTSTSTISDIRGTLYDTDGNVIGNADSQLLAELGAKEQVWITRDNFASRVGAEWDGAAMLEVGSVSGLKLLNLNFVNNETFFNFSCFESSSSGRVYLMTNSASDNVSFTHIVNTSGSTQQFTGTLYNGDGDQLGDAGVALHSGSVNSKGRIILSASDLESLFGVSAWSGPAILDVAGSGNFELMTKLTSPSGLISNTNCVRSDEVHNIEGSDSMDMTYVRFINNGSQTMSNITGTLYDSTGTQVGSANTTLRSTLAPNQAVWLTRTNLESLFGSSWTGEATLDVDGTSDLRLLNLNFANSETFFNFSCYEGS
ncbi:MAG: hypothetical protein HOC70_16555 [Gammaproteobacteria bacterium]|jgi:hypothetical protein|nr:hypothetical protein [Gammaproteobacteria bacterium]